METMHGRVQTHYWKLDQEFMEREVYGVAFDIASMNRNIDSISYCLGLVEIIMELPANSFSDEILSYELVCLNEPYVNNFQDQCELSNISDYCNIILEPCIPCEKVCMRRPPRVHDEDFYFYSGVIEDFGMGIPFTIFQTEILRPLNVSHFQLYPKVGHLRSYVGASTSHLPLTYFFFL